MASVRHPLRTIRDCGLGASPVRDGVYVTDPTAVTNPHFYYLRAFGPWTEAPAAGTDELVPRLFTAGRQTPVLVPRHALAGTLHRAGESVPAAESRRWLTLPGVEVDPAMVVLLPGPYAPCAAAATSAGGVPVSLLPGTGH